MKLIFLGLLLLLAGCSWMAPQQTSAHTAPPPPAPTGIAPSAHALGDLADVQQRLTESGDYHGPIDGRMGTATAAALRRYQSEHDLPVTGLADDPTRERLGL
jgi:peptidoglycan hydrolase-like protein with peptidoglycan-binding domain